MDIVSHLSKLRTDFMELAISQRETNQTMSYINYQHAMACEAAVNELARLNPKEMELEGGGHSWWYVCPECHGEINRQDKFCKHCGQTVKSD